MIVLLDTGPLGRLTSPKGTPINTLYLNWLKSLIANGVTIYSDGGGPISMVGTGQLTISPPSSGPYQGISIFQERASAQTITVKGNGTNVTGTIYARSAGLAIDGGGGTVGSQYILSTLSLNGVPGTVNVPYSANNTAKTLVASLVF